jgi:hypothetical protein
VAHECNRDGIACFGYSACYGHLKAQALKGGRSKLSERELEFVGVCETRMSSDGWVQPGQLPALRSVDERDADPELTAILQARRGAVRSGEPDRGRRGVDGYDVRADRAS